MFFDSHAHIAAPELAAEASAMLARARDAGVCGIIAVGAGYGVGANAAAVTLAEEHPDVWATTGVHPHDASEWSESTARTLDGWLTHERVVAVGECGLDYHYDHSPREAQAECLRNQIATARRHDLPLVIHVRASADSRNALDDLLRIFDEAGAERVGGVIHCFSGDLAFANECLARGFDISFSGVITFQKAEALREVARKLPLERLLVETDTPLLAPAPYRGKRNEPAYVSRVVECLAKLRSRSVAAIADATRQRAHTLFRLADGT